MLASFALARAKSDSPISSKSESLHAATEHSRSVSPDNGDFSSVGHSNVFGSSDPWLSYTLNTEPMNHMPLMSKTTTSGRLLQHFCRREHYHFGTCAGQWRRCSESPQTKKVCSKLLYSSTRLPRCHAGKQSTDLAPI